MGIETTLTKYGYKLTNNKLLRHIAIKNAQICKNKRPKELEPDLQLQ